MVLYCTPNYKPTDRYHILYATKILYLNVTLLGVTLEEIIVDTFSLAFLFFLFFCALFGSKLDPQEFCSPKNE